MNLRIEKIRLEELETFANSKMFHEFDSIPISPNRVRSYLANPNAAPDDVVLYLGFVENQLVAFRSLFADVVYSGKQQIRFGWCSGNWVHPDFRRKGFSEQLLKEAYEGWDRKLMFTNYAPNSEKLYLKTTCFKAIFQFQGARAYLYPKTRKLVAKANSNLIFKIGFLLIDGLISMFSQARLCFCKAKENSRIKFESMEYPDEQCYRSIKTTGSILKRNEKEFRWIFSYPWISSEQSEWNKKYCFSSFSASFKYHTVKVFSNDQFLGFFIFSVREGHLKTLYWNVPDVLTKDIASYFKLFCKQNKIEVATFYKKELAKELFKRKFPFLHLKKYGQKIYSTFELNNSEAIQFQDGDGDVIFT